MMKTMVFSLVLALLAVSTILVGASGFGTYTVLEQINVPADELAKTSITWHPLSKPYSCDNLLIGIQPVNIQFNTSATEKKFVIEIAGYDTSTHLDLAFYDTGVIDIVDTTSNGANKLADTSNSGIKWQSIKYIIVMLNGTTVKLLSNNGTVLATVTWTHEPSSIEQIGASAGVDSVVSGNIIISVLDNPFSDISSGIGSMTAGIISLIGIIIGIAIPLIIMKIVLRSFSKIF